MPMSEEDFLSGGRLRGRKRQKWGIWRAESEDGGGKRKEGSFERVWGKLANMDQGMYTTVYSTCVTIACISGRRFVNEET